MWQAPACLEAGNELMSAIRMLRAFALIAVLGLAPVARAADPPLLVFAAASLKNALDEVDAQWAHEVTASYAATSALARQVESGAPADVFISADTEWMDWLAQRELVVAATRRDLLGNRLVLVAPAGAGISTRIAPGFALAALLGGDGRLAMGDPAAVPAGKYGRAALEKLGVWGAVAARVVPAENVRAALAFVARREAALGIVYATDARADPGVEVVDTFPEDAHPRIVYPAARVAAGTHPDADAYLRFLRTSMARAAFVKHGFRVLD